MRQNVDTIGDAVLLRERLEHGALFPAAPTSDDEPPRDRRPAATNLLKGTQQIDVSFALVEIPNGEEHALAGLPADLGAHSPRIPGANGHTVRDDGEFFRWKAKLVDE